MDEKYTAYLKSEEWRDLKIDLINKRGSKCEICGKSKVANKLHIHHLTYERIYHELPSDLQILCSVCHMKEHGLIKEKVKREKAKKPKKQKQKSNIWQVVAKAKSGRYANDKSILSAYKKASKRMG
jgi:DNA-binding transcriptional regulator YhcF (GntR family)